MTQETFAGVILCILGIALSVNPYLVWKLTEKWKSAGSTRPSSWYFAIVRMLSGLFLGLGFCLAMGYIR